MIKKNQNLAVFSRLCIFVSLILVGSSVTTFLPEITLIKHFMSEKHQGMLPNVIILEFQIWMYVFLKSLTYCIVNTSAVLGQIFVMFTPAFGFYDQPLVFLKSLYSNVFFIGIHYMQGWRATMSHQKKKHKKVKAYMKSV